MKYCIYCDKEISDDSLYCIYCGKKQNSIVPAMPDKTEKLPPLRGAGVGFALTFFISGLIGFVLSMIFGDNNCRTSAIITFVIKVILYIILFVFVIDSSRAINNYYNNVI